MSEFDEYDFVEGIVDDIVNASAMEAISGYKRLLIDDLTAVRDKIFDGKVVIDGEKDPYKIGQVDMIDCVLSILGYKPFNAETGEEAGIKDD